MEGRPPGEGATVNQCPESEIRRHLSTGTLTEDNTMNTSRRLFRPLVGFLLAALLSVSAPGAGAADPPDSSSMLLADPFPVGKGVVEVDFHGTPLRLHYYKPATYTGERFILVFHGASRTASGYRDSASGMGDAFESLVVVPEFDLERFPNRLYQFGGVLREDGSFADAEEWTYAYVPQIVEYIRGREGEARLPHLILGFSAGGQFVSRMGEIRKK